MAKTVWLLATLYFYVNQHDIAGTLCLFNFVFLLFYEAFKDELS